MLRLERVETRFFFHLSERNPDLEELIDLLDEELQQYVVWKVVDFPDDVIIMTKYSTKPRRNK